jgi:HEPN domain-containing protein
MTPKAELVAEWLSKADDDLRLAELALSAEPPVPWGGAFHSQQAVEKLLKALLTFRGVTYEKTHSIDYLMDLCERAGLGTSSLRKEASELTDFAVEPRYPFPRRDPSLREARRALATAREMRLLVRDAIPADDLAGGALG